METFQTGLTEEIPSRMIETENSLLESPEQMTDSQAGMKETNISLEITEMKKSSARMEDSGMEWNQIITGKTEADWNKGRLSTPEEEMDLVRTIIYPITDRPMDSSQRMETIMNRREECLVDVWSTQAAWTKFLLRVNTVMTVTTTTTEVSLNGTDVAGQMNKCNTCSNNIYRIR